MKDGDINRIFDNRMFELQQIKDGVLPEDLERRKLSIKYIEDECVKRNKIQHMDINQIEYKKMKKMFNIQQSDMSNPSLVKKKINRYNNLEKLV